MKAAVIGAPISHSLSPALHRAAYAALGLGDWTYEAIECDETGLPGLLRGCGPGWAGLSVTMPCKCAVLPLLDRAEPLVAQVQAANTVLFASAERRGYNTDVPGMITALTESRTGAATGSRPAAGVRPAAADLPPHTMILGSGATGRAALAALHRLGCRAVTAAVRDPARAGLLRVAAGRLGMRLDLVAFGAQAPVSGGLLISTVPAGAADIYAEQVAVGTLRPTAVLDVVYHPWPTRLAAAAAAAGAVVTSGFELLLHQAARQVELMTGRPAPVTAMRAGGLAEIAARTAAGPVAGPAAGTAE